MVTMNVGALHGAEDGAARRDGLAGMKARFAEIASDPAMFGEVPNADLAAEALRSAAESMLRELERAGLTVEDIRASAAAAAGIGEESDEAARATLSSARIEAATAFDTLMETRE
ncbi:hypothetical protein [Streptomyces litchfieldiae]|uniref:Uncharacterized protein n=1 Tax=Streptomyces litchfieldiae TaxID=3075543 RepID=A0ABU2MY74_9ACTN|nr:hypothetical protein [Streptomyces sp. DSM 44938]MDT0346575.1 hypothetical protein [Streptomyces sp. DSM 44938]